MQGGISIVRPASSGDIAPIIALLQPFMLTGAVINVDQNFVTTELSTFAVCEIEHDVIACAKLNDYGFATELAKFCILKEHQGKGHSKKLAAFLVDLARKQGKQYIFALSIEARMWEFFLDIGFQECLRSELPEAWQSKYDMSRPSKAFKLTLDT